MSSYVHCVQYVHLKSRYQKITSKKIYLLGFFLFKIFISSFLFTSVYYYDFFNDILSLKLVKFTTQKLIIIFLNLKVLKLILFCANENDNFFLLVIDNKDSNFHDYFYGNQTNWHVTNLFAKKNSNNNKKIIIFGLF